MRKHLTLKQCKKLFWTKFSSEMEIIADATDNDTYYGSIDTVNSKFILSYCIKQLVF
jgi:hypothetical protein